MELKEWCVNLFQNWFQKRVFATDAVVVSRLRKDAALLDLPVTAKCRGKGRPRKYGVNSISLARRGGHPQCWTTARLVLYGKEQTVRNMTFLATCAPVGGAIRVVIVKRSAELFSDCPAEWVAFFCTDADVSAETTIESVAQRSDRPWEATVAAERVVRMEAEGGSIWQRPSHTDRIKPLKKHTLRETLSQSPRHQRTARKIRQLFQALTKLIT